MFKPIENRLLLLEVIYIQEQMIHIKLVNPAINSVLSDAQLKYKNEPIFGDLFSSYFYKDIRLCQGWGKKEIGETRPIPFDRDEVQFQFIDGLYCRVIQTNVPSLTLNFSTPNINFDFQTNLITFFPTYIENII